jgi:hypothetical protein
MILYYRIMNKKEIRELYKKLNVNNDLDLENMDQEENMEIKEILEKLEDEQHDYLQNKTLASISKDIYDILKFHEYTDDKIESMYNKLNGYRYVENIHELHSGKDVKVLRISNPYDANFNKMDSVIKYFGKVTNIVFEDNGVLIRCVMFTNKLRYCNYKYDNFLTFQKLSDDEKIILTLL